MKPRACLLPQPVRLHDRHVSDHFGDNGQAHVRGKQFCYDEGLLVPLIIRWPKAFPAPKTMRPGATDMRLLEAIDLAPTMLDIAGLKKPAGMQGRIFLGPGAEKPRQYVFGARDRCDETVFRLRTVRDERFRYIRNFTPERPFLQPNNYKARQYPLWTLLPELNRQGLLTPEQASLCAPTMPAEELYDLQADPHAVHNLAASPRFQKTLQKLRSVLDQWIQQTADMGRTLEPQHLVESQGLTKPGNNPNTGYTLPEKK